MKKRLPGIFSSVLFFLLANSFPVVERQPVDPLLYYHIGQPFPWLTIYSSEPGRSVYSLFFGGSEGAGLNPLSLGLMLLLTAAVGCMVDALYRKHLRRKAAREEELKNQRND